MTWLCGLVLIRLTDVGTVRQFVFGLSVGSSVRNRELLVPLRGRAGGCSAWVLMSSGANMLIVTSCGVGMLCYTDL